MPYTTQTISNLHRVGLKEIIDLHEKEAVKQYTDLVGDEVNTRQAFERFYQISDFGVGLPTTEGNGVVFDALLPGNQLDVYPVMRTTGFSITKQAQYTDFYGVLKRNTKKMATAMTKTLELVVANYFYNGFTDTTTIDSVSLFSTAHPLATGTIANRPSTELAFGFLNLESEMQQLRQQKTHRGLPMPFAGGLKVVIPGALEGTGRRVMQSSGMAGTNDNDVNWVKTRTQLVINDYMSFNSTTAWYLLPSDNSLNPVRIMRRIPRFTEDDYDIRYQKFLMTMGEEYAVFHADFRNTRGTLGA